jgi:hypothetical protein
MFYLFFDVSLLVMSNQRYFKIVCFRFATNVPKKSNIFVFGTKFIVGSKRSLSVLKIFGPKEIDLFCFQIFFEISKVLFCFRNLQTKSKRFCIVSKFLDQIETFCFC